MKDNTPAVVEQQVDQPTSSTQKNFKTIGSYTIDFGKLLGKGKYGKVYPAFHKQEAYATAKRYACKMIEMQGSSPDKKIGQ